MSIEPHPALLVTDVQNDFCSGGTLVVPHADLVITALNRYLGEAAARGMTVYACRDWHPAVTRHFATHGGLWPAHCVQGTNGARFHPDLHLPSSAIVITKGQDPSSDGYSAFDGTTADGQSFLADLRRRGVNHLYVGGIATDYCVKQSVVDALASGLRVTVLEDAIAGVNSEDAEQAVSDMSKQGAQVASSFTASGAQHGD